MFPVGVREHRPELILTEAPFHLLDKLNLVPKYFRQPGEISLAEIMLSPGLVQGSNQAMLHLNLLSPVPCMLAAQKSLALLGILTSGLSPAGLCRAGPRCAIKQFVKFWHGGQLALTGSLALCGQH
jgi:hypothetical protein